MGLHTAACSVLDTAERPLVLNRTISALDFCSTLHITVPLSETSSPVSGSWSRLSLMTPLQYILAETSSSGRRQNGSVLSPPCSIDVPVLTPATAHLTCGPRFTPDSCPGDKNPGSLLSHPRAHRRRLINGRHRCGSVGVRFPAEPCFLRLSSRSHLSSLLCVRSFLAVLPTSVWTVSVTHSSGYQAADFECFPRALLEVWTPPPSRPSSRCR